VLLRDDATEIHPVQLVAAEDQGVLEIVVEEVVMFLRTASAVPWYQEVLEGSARRRGSHEAAGEVIELVRLGDVPVQRGRVELREQVDALEVGVDAVGDRDVDQAILARQRHRGLGAFLGQREQARALAAAHDDGKGALGNVRSKRGRHKGGCSTCRRRFPFVASVPGEEQAKAPHRAQYKFMCGIVGYIGRRSSVPILLEGLRRLEYRGYDSAGICVLTDAGLQMRKKVGRIDAGLAQECVAARCPGRLGIGHTRWATHGPPCDANSHPHLDRSGRIAVVHNGVIENYLKLKEQMVAAGHTFVSETDTEVLAHLIGVHYEHALARATNGRFPPAYRRRHVRPAGGDRNVRHRRDLRDHPGIMVGARRGSPPASGSASTRTSSPATPAPSSPIPSRRCT
jgi:hypothetical protein